MNWTFKKKCGAFRTMPMSMGCANTRQRLRKKIFVDLITKSDISRRKEGEKRRRKEKKKGRMETVKKNKNGGEK